MVRRKSVPFKQSRYEVDFSTVASTSTKKLISLISSSISSSGQLSPRILVMFVLPCWTLPRETSQPIFDAPSSAALILRQQKITTGITYVETRALSKERPEVA